MDLADNQGSFGDEQLAGVHAAAIFLISVGEMVGQEEDQDIGNHK